MTKAKSAAKAAAKPAAKRAPAKKAASDGVEIRPLAASDEKALLAFARSLPPHDLLFLPRDISEPKVLKAWIRESEGGGMMSLVAAEGDTIVGCGAIAHDPLSWSPHVGELRVLLGPAARGKGVGRRLTQRLFALALEAGLQRIVAQMTVDQTAAISVFEGLGFRAEAMLRGHVKDRAGKRHDIVILGHEVADVLARLEAFGVVEATSR
ncbi:MAG: GNAT family N-acetyltransferase [Hyphomicrobiales bacterium]|nr:GNAT family N-acetyltransferase [Hyphomicrobiales bacterium]